MERKTFLKKGLLGTGMLAAASVFGKNLLEEESAPEIVGFNHLPISNTEVMSNSVLHKAGSRGLADHGWLKSRHSFSFASYYNPERMNFGALRVLNDDIVAAGMGFGKHPHDNMEIISIPLEGDLEHQDSMGNQQVIRNGDIQVMSAGTGIRHSEYNRSKNELVRFLQIWIVPKTKQVKPRYDQITLDLAQRKNRLQQILSPNPDDEGVWIHQDAWFHLGTFSEGISTAYSLKKAGNGIYAFVLSGKFEVEGQVLETRDALGLWDTSKIDLKSRSENAEILLMEVPMAI